MHPRRAFRALLLPRALIALVMLATVPQPIVFASEEEDAKELASGHKSDSHEAASASEGHGRASHPDDVSGSDPGPEEGHGDTHEASEGESTGAVKLKPAAHEASAHADPHEKTSEQAKAKTTKPKKATRAFWEDGVIWFGLVFVTLLAALFIFI